jgi:hypothetical protein
MFVLTKAEHAYMGFAYVSKAWDSQAAEGGQWGEGRDTPRLCQHGWDLGEARAPLL